MTEDVSKKVDEFFLKHTYQTYKKGQVLVRADETPSGVFYIKTGIVREYAISKQGEEVVVNVFKPNSFFPMSWAINQTPNAYFYEAITGVELWRAQREDVVDFLRNNPDVVYNLLSRVFSGLDGLLMRMTYLMSSDANTRLIIELLIYAKRFAQGKTQVELQISEKDIASQSGMTRETVSREMKTLKEKSLIINRDNTFIIPDIKKLELELTS